LEDLGFGSLWVAKVHHLVQQFVYDDKIVSYTFLLELFEIFGEHLDNLVEEKEDFSGIGVTFCESEEVEIVVTNVKVLSLAQQMYTECKWFLCLRMHTLIPSSEKHGGTAEDSSSASESNMGNFSTADIGISPR